MKHIMFATIAVFVTGAGAVAACPNFNAPAGESYRATGRELYDPKAFNVRAGGNNYIWNCPSIRPGSDQGAGYFPTAPDFAFQLSGMSGFQLEVRIVSQCDSALLINTSSSNWYYDDDDNGNYDPRIILTRPADGRVDIWVGTYDGAYCDAQLQLETFER